MPKRTTTRKLPERVERELNKVVEELLRIVNGDGELDRAHKATDMAALAALAEAERARQVPVHASHETLAGFGAVIARRIKEAREEAGWSQTDLAEPMAEYFNWTRITVAEVELRKRRVQLEELAVLAGLFGMPIADFMMPAQPVRLDLGAVILTTAQVRELLLGPGGTVGIGGPSWPTAARVATRVRERPAVDLWAARSKRRTKPSSSSARRARGKER